MEVVEVESHLILSSVRRETGAIMRSHAVITDVGVCW